MLEPEERNAVCLGEGEDGVAPSEEEQILLPAASSSDAVPPPTGDRELASASENTTKNGVENGGKGGRDSEAASPLATADGGTGLGAETGMTGRQMATAYFVSIATILGTGILALPVKLYGTGFWPFATGFSISLGAQLLVALFMIELLQQARGGREETSEGIPMQELSKPSRALQRPGDPLDDSEVTLSASPAEGLSTALGATLLLGATPTGADGQPTLPRSRDRTSGGLALTRGASLHSLSARYLGRFGGWIFNSAALLHFYSILISYCLAWSKAFCSVRRPKLGRRMPHCEGCGFSGGYHSGPRYILRRC